MDYQIVSQYFKVNLLRSFYPPLVELVLTLTLGTPQVLILEAFQKWPVQ